MSLGVLTIQHADGEFDVTIRGGELRRAIEENEADLLLVELTGYDHFDDMPPSLQSFFMLCEDSLCDDTEWADLEGTF